MPGITLDLSDAAELAEMLTFLADWLSAARNKPSPAASRPMPATPPTAPRLSAPTCTGSPSCPGSATAKNSSASPAARPHPKETRRE